MKTTDTKEIQERVKTFLSNIAKTKEPSIIFSSESYKPMIMLEIKKAFQGRDFAVIEPVMADSEQVDKIFRTSMREGSVLIISIDNFSIPTVTRRLEQLIEDGHVPVQVGSGWQKVEPVEDWQVVVWVSRDHIKEDTFILSNIFANKLVIGE